ncbi:MAG: 23S rRNA pseudouridine(955/2504/2580) synthase RluC [Candidatus Symbiodolus clandestinus]
MTVEPSIHQWRQITAEEATQRIDNYLCARLKSVPKSLIYRLLRSGAIRVNQRRIKPFYRLQPEDVIKIPALRTAQAPIPLVKLSRVKALEHCILYEDDSLLLLNKPSGMAVHGGSGVTIGVIEGLRALYSKLSSLELVHRLDRDTSGLLMVSKKSSVLRALHQQLREQQVKKCYYLLVHGCWPESCQQIDAPLLKRVLTSGERFVQVHPQGKPATTKFKLLERFSQASLLQATLVTGRTHQIRVHVQSAGHPIVSDRHYGDRQLDAQLLKPGDPERLFLHAATLQFSHPKDNQPLLIKAPLEADLRKLLQRLRVKKSENSIRS